MYEVMKEVTQDVNDIELQIELGNLNEGVAIAKDAEKNGFHVIISRGGTASLIQEAVSIPVIDIQVSGYDVLRILTMVKGFSQKAAIVGFSNITQGAGTICKLLDFDIKTLTIKKEIEVTETLANLKNQGYEVVIGDVITVQFAKELGLTGVLITSGKEAIIEALEETRRIYKVFSQLQQDVSFYRTILSCSKQAIAILNKDKDIFYSNERFTKDINWMKVKNSDTINNLIQEIVITRKKIIKMVHLNDSLWKITACLKGNYIVLFIENNLTNESTIREGIYVNAIEIHTPDSTFSPFSGKSEQIQNVLKKIEQYSKKDDAVWISGEKGNGKSKAAQLINQNRRSQSELFITINCEQLTAEQLKEMNEGLFLTLTDGVIFLRNIHKLNLYVQKELYQVYTNGNGKKLKWIVSSDENMEDKVKSGSFHQELYKALAKLTIYIPPIRERREDIKDLVHLFISELHPKYGNGAIGIRQEAMEEILKYSWPGNVQQLKQVIEELFLQSHTYYIEKEEVEALLGRIELKGKKDGLFVQIDINGTLEEIEKQVIRKVLEEEGLNQSKAAKRLGINRSTLWRKLK
ncbi:sigma-54-dependent Fis family transcriptional regulator [Neobacillus niacini]|uniref:sigma-54-dependent Fis family transcriptional regulator n=1 Tax=Neobacillus niacini TaxID=86668 RepID=UPI00203E1D0F|nr:sigma-54-dependent transcriptional regulator [Neobacillus niacini]MCM3694018.1 PrpR N-terminal domain-containing protein [Neobacillus niacini]